MKKVLYIVLALTLFTLSCKSKRLAKEEAKKEAAIKEEAKLPVNSKTSDMNQEQSNMDRKELDSEIALISISRSVCFGVCPAYSAQIFKDGTVLYTGTKNVENIGKYKGKLEMEKIYSLISEITELQFFELEDVYDNKYVSDLPTTVTFVKSGNKVKKIICRFECDERLTMTNKMIDELLIQVELKSIK